MTIPVGRLTSIIKIICENLFNLRNLRAILGVVCISLQHRIILCEKFIKNHVSA